MNGQIQIETARLRTMIKEKGLTPNSLSRKADLAAFTVYSLIKGQTQKIYFSTLAAICGVLECQPGDFLTYIESNGENRD